MLDGGAGAAAWTLAAVAGVVLAIAVLTLLGSDRAQGLAPAWPGVVVVLAGAVWVAGMVVPAVPGLSVADHVEHVLFGGDTFFDIVTAAFIGVPAALVVVAAASRSRAAHGLAAGTMVFWTTTTVASSAAAGSSDAVVASGFGHFWAALAGAVGVAVGCCAAVLLPEDPTERRVVPLVPAVGLALLPLAGVVGAVQYADRDEGPGVEVAGGSLASFGTYPSGDMAGDYEPTFDEYDQPDQAPDEAGGGAAGTYDVVCTDEVASTVESAWQDVDGAIHVLVLVDNDCEIGQSLDDPTASFTLTSAGSTVADATFDFSSRPVVVPAQGSSQAELVFGPGTFVDLATVETLGLGGASGSSGGAAGLDLVFSYTCTDAPGGTTSSDRPEVAGEAIAVPVAATTTEGDALDRLGEIAAADAPFVESDVIDRWVPQISSKRPDVPLPDGTVWTALAILEDHRSWREQFPRVRLLWSGDYSTFAMTDYWVTIVAVSFDTPEGALGWCDAHALPGEDCYAKLISHTHPQDGSTRHR
jgi:hypothetical protein